MGSFGPAALRPIAALSSFPWAFAQIEVFAEFPVHQLARMDVLALPAWIISGWRLTAPPSQPEISDYSANPATILIMDERRNCSRRNLDMFFNKFINGHPYLCRTLDVSPAGLLAVTYTEPDSQSESFPVEIRLPNSHESLWLWARTVRWTGRQQAMKFVRMARRDRAILKAELFSGTKNSGSVQSRANS